MPHERYTDCIEACSECAVACNHCAASCLRHNDVKMMARCIALNVDCAAICQLATVAMARGSEYATAICRLCADICQACGDECAMHKAQHCQDCAAACHRCAEACLRMANR
jgi:hypothetical protein